MICHVDTSSGLQIIYSYTSIHMVIELGLFHLKPKGVGRHTFLTYPPPRIKFSGCPLPSEFNFSGTPSHLDI